MDAGWKAAEESKGENTGRADKAGIVQAIIGKFHSMINA